MSIERQELHCHECRRYVQFDLDLSLNGNHVLNCPNCGHQHCRVVRDGRITDIRWGHFNGPAITVSPYSIVASTASVLTNYTLASGTTNGAFLHGAWLNTMATS